MTSLTHSYTPCPPLSLQYPFSFELRLMFLLEALSKRDDLRIPTRQQHPGLFQGGECCGHPSPELLKFQVVLVGCGCRRLCHLLRSPGQSLNLRRLDISDLLVLSKPGLALILVEEMLPNCEILGAEWAQGLKSESEKQSQDTASPIST